MLSWFNDLPREIFDGYNQTWPLPDGFSQRQPVYQLYYLLNRANVFGGNWLGAAQLAVGQLLDDDALAAGQAKPA